MITDLLPSDDQAAIRDSVVALLSREFPIARLHGDLASGAGVERARWGMFADLGLFGLAVGEQQGGAGFALPEQVTAAYELGRFLVSPTVLATMIAAGFAQGEMLESLVAGDARVAFANPVSRLQIHGGGSAPVQLLDADGADFVLLWTDEGAALHAAPAPGPHVEALDETVSLQRAELALGGRIAATTGPDIARRGGLLLSAYLVGIAKATLEMAVEYSKSRVQFGQEIGAFQAIKHYCAEMARRAEAATAQTFYAALDATVRRDEDMFEAAAARLLAAEAAVDNARFNIQIHGAMGFTYEADAHLYLKRALLVSAILSDQRSEQRRIMRSEGLAAAELDLSPPA